ncbi:MAG: hypothetical protein RIQ53_3094, partial [Pseudomonadota bacterium]
MAVAVVVTGVVAVAVSGAAVAARRR